MKIRMGFNRFRTGGALRPALALKDLPSITTPWLRGQSAAFNTYRPSAPLHTTFPHTGHQGTDIQSHRVTKQTAAPHLPPWTWGTVPAPAQQQPPSSGLGTCREATGSGKGSKRVQVLVVGWKAVSISPFIQSRNHRAHHTASSNTIRKKVRFHSQPMEARGKHRVATWESGSASGGAKEGPQASPRGEVGGNGEHGDRGASPEKGEGHMLTSKRAGRATMGLLKDKGCAVGGELMGNSVPECR